MTTKFWKPKGSSKLIRHSRYDFFAPVDSTGRGVPPPTSTGRLQLLCQVSFQPMRESTQQLSNWLVRPAHADTLAPRPPAGWRDLTVWQKRWPAQYAVTVWQKRWPAQYAVTVWHKRWPAQYAVTVWQKRWPAQYSCYGVTWEMAGSIYCHWKTNNIFMVLTFFF